jgi:L-asparaginase
MSRKRVHVVTLGGTIAMTDPDGSGATPTMDAEALTRSVPGLAETAEISTETFRQVPGAHLALQDLVALARRLHHVIDDGCDGVVVTQGTDTVEESAFALDLLTNRAAPVVLTGAMRPPAQAGSDGAANLLNAVRVAASPAARGLGVMVTLDDLVHAARFVHKAHTSRPSSFASPTAGPLGWVAEDRVRLPLRLANRVHIDIPEGRDLPRVLLTRVVMADDLGMVADSACDGLVVEGFGVGHTPRNAAEELIKTASRIPVVLASRTGAGETFRNTYGFPGSEQDLLSQGLIPAGILDGPKARILLACGLAADWSAERLHDAYDLLMQ